MHWECSDCGATTKQRRPPVVCPSCSVSTAVFLPAELGALAKASAHLRDVWAPRPGSQHGASLRSGA